ncbi:hypothetical protein MHUMG1_07324 [Metarhizium humberi]|uniref:NB-ARC domain-containing protein n=1 Tax=Metarhizium humberi TaxID=2596975 RepID=A0A9P8M777_9HYPO|nr:hypothetical protein MHUMG1_07324 [Metarhizium humberi]
MLPHDLGNARIMSFGYNSVWYGEDAVKQSLQGVACKLLYALGDKRQSCLHRPILFIGHCFGGLVIQMAYTMTLLQSQDWPHLFESVIGLLFLGTPHYGITESSYLNTQGQIYQAIVAAELPIEDNALHTMAHDNDLLRDTVVAFTRKIATVEPKPILFCFYEEKPTKVGLIIGQDTAPEFVVNKTSGILSGCENEGLSLDHFLMNKFEDSQDYHYLCVKREILKMVKKFQDREEPVSEGSPKLELHRSMPRLGAPIAAESNFAPRDQIIQKLESLFKKKKLVALYGASGNGKTHIAVAYAHEYNKSHPGCNVYWANANSLEELESSYIRIAERLNMTLDNGGNVNVIQAVRHRLKKEPFLMVLDGMDSEACLPLVDLSSEEPLSDVVPPTSRANFLVTTRSKAVATHLVNGKAKYVIEVSPVDHDDASHILLGKVSKDPTRRQSVDQISKILNGSAGALAMATSYLNHAGKAINRKMYLEKLNSRPPEQSGALRAWELLHDLIKRKHRETVDTMLIMSCLDVQCIPSELFERSVVQEYLPVLEEHCIVEPSTDRQLFTITAMYRDLAQQWLANDGQQRECIEDLALDAVRKRFGEDTSETLLPCLLAALKLQHVSVRGKRTQSALLFCAAKHDMDRNNYKRALRYLEQCLAMQEADADVADKSTLMAKTRQAIQQAKAGLSRTNEQTATDSKDAGANVAAATQMQLFNPADAPWSHGDTGRGVMSLDQDRDDYNQCIETVERDCKQGLDQAAKGRYQRAEKLYRSALQVLRSQMNPAHPEKVLMILHLKILSCLAGMYCSQGQLNEAAEILGAVLPEQEEILGKNHPETLLTRNDHALLLQDRDPDAAARELRRIHMAQVQVLGRDDSATLRTESNLALNCKLQGKMDEAKTLYEDVLHRQKRELEENHPDVQATQQMLKELLEKGASKGVMST